ncbi:VOC family protein [Lacibacterium aquatile]|uniref:VOC family protein n=1 Tax=Lacibacterium aquatile TaxID=1168082 RepID=A0ABW5DYK8_9PROT
MEFHTGRLIDHVHLRVKDLEASHTFYAAVLTALGKGGQLLKTEDHFNIDELWVDRADGYTSKVHLAFQAADRVAVERFHRAGLAAGGKDNGAPGERPYHPGYYGAFLIDPDGNNIEAVFHGPSTRTAESVVVTPK